MGLGAHRPRCVGPPRLSRSALLCAGSSEAWRLQLRSLRNAEGKKPRRGRAVEAWGGARSPPRRTERNPRYNGPNPPQPKRGALRMYLERFGVCLREFLCPCLRRVPLVGVDFGSKSLLPARSPAGLRLNNRRLRKPPSVVRTRCAAKNSNIKGALATWTTTSV